ncbi:MAG: hypothetical protein ACREV1_09420 [Gammaproteobacteria bacterium]
MTKWFIIVGVVISIAGCNDRPREVIQEPTVEHLSPGFEPCALGPHPNKKTCEPFQEKFLTTGIDMFIEYQIPNNTKCCTVEFRMVQGVMTPVGQKCDTFDGSCPAGWWRKPR